jgi:uncharacterized membrane protein
MDKTYKSRSALKTDVKQLFKNNWGTAIRLNLVPTILIIIVGIAAGAALTMISAFIIQNPTPFQDTVHEMASDPSNHGGNGGSGGIGGFILGLVTTGILFTSLDWLRTREAPGSALKGAFAVFSKRYFLGTVVVELLTLLFTFLWMLLLVVPGIVKSYAYSQATFIFKDQTDAHPNENISYLDCITKSRQLMHGHKWRFFMLQLSFIGWDLLACLTFGIGYLWLMPYKNATYAAFYQDLVA